MMRLKKNPFSFMDGMFTGMTFVLSVELLLIPRDFPTTTIVLGGCLAASFIGNVLFVRWGRKYSTFTRNDEEEEDESHG